MIGEQAEKENWRGMVESGRPSKKRRIGFYTTPDPEFISLADHCNAAKVGIMKNGNCASLKAVPVDGVRVSLMNTCGVDALAHLVAAAYCDSEKYRSYVQTLSTSQPTIVGLGVSLATKGVRNATYVYRARLTRAYLETTPLNGKLVRIDCTNTAAHLAKVLRFPPSTVERKVCSSSFLLTVTFEKILPLPTPL